MTRKLNPKSKSAHTPTPYHVRPDSMGTERDIYNGEELVARINGSPRYRAYGAFIVRACNSHEKLFVAAQRSLLIFSILEEERDVKDNMEAIEFVIKELRSAIAEAEK